MGGTNRVFRPWNPLGSILGPTCPPNGPKTLQETILGPFWYHFGTILVSILEPFWAIHGWKNVPTWLQNSLVKSIKPMSKPKPRWRLVGAAGGYYYIIILLYYYIILLLYYYIIILLYYHIIILLYYYIIILLYYYIIILLYY